MFFNDLDPCDYFGQGADVLRAVGWLEAGRPYARGPVADGFFEALVRLLVNPWEPAVVAGPMHCGFCRFSSGPSQLSYRAFTIQMGTKNLFVPSSGFAFVAPSLIAHYVDAHEYCPPIEFQEAVLTCQEMRSMPYLKAVSALGLTKLKTAAR